MSRGSKTTTPAPWTFRRSKPRELARIMGSLEASTDAPFRELKRDIDSRLGLKFRDAYALCPGISRGPFFHRATDVRTSTSTATSRGGPGGPHPQYLRCPWIGRAGCDLIERSLREGGKNQHAFCAAWVANTHTT